MFAWSVVRRNPVLMFPSQLVISRLKFTWRQKTPLFRLISKWRKGPGTSRNTSGSSFMTVRVRGLILILMIQRSIMMVPSWVLPVFLNRRLSVLVNLTMQALTQPRGVLRTMMMIQKFPAVWLPSQRVNQKLNVALVNPQEPNVEQANLENRSTTGVPNGWNQLGRMGLVGSSRGHRDFLRTGLGYVVVAASC